MERTRCGVRHTLRAASTVTAQPSRSPSKTSFIGAVVAQTQPFTIRDIDTRDGRNAPTTPSVARTSRFWDLPPRPTMDPLCSRLTGHRPWCRPDLEDGDCIELKPARQGL